MKIGFIGLGRMGSGMARNLLRAGHEVTVYNRTPEKAQAIVAEGARVADSPADAAAVADAVLSMLADDRAVEEVTFGDRGIVTGLKRGNVHISSSTVSTALARRLAAVHAGRGQQYLSAPVFGRPDAAEAKRLVVVPAGAAELIERCRPVFEAIGRATFIAGDEPWRANAVKLCGNFMIASMLEAFGEAFAVLRKAGVDPHTFLEIINSLFASPVYANYGRIMADETFEPAGFALKLGLKDVRLALATAEECAAPMPFASVIRDQFLAAIAHGQSELDWSSIGRVSARQAGL
ncbi:MAG TPA: NAD(P)-dependent oxidoreductase [Bryobacteraceae bacterium]|jgi:3-hydroxyisobutyrate dehydrogenase-like beta-hydroxyacid dehydrogenase|nr:NAD(P)-dependent oxidoreductase [Bryobacteraceae bacterium]